jgi:hypothetical protein
MSSEAPQPTPTTAPPTTAPVPTAEPTATVDPGEVGTSVVTGAPLPTLAAARR